MKLSVEILDLIFSFLASDQETITACSNDPVLSPIVERYLHHHIQVSFGDGWRDHDYSIRRDNLSKLVSENPRIPYYVKILQIRVHFDRHPEDEDLLLKRHLDGFAKTLLMFPVLECIMLNTSRRRICSWPDIFRAALEDRLNLPTLKEVHIVGNQESPCSLIDNRKNITNLVLSGSFSEAKRRSCDSPLPQLKSLTLLTHLSLLPSVMTHIKELQSLKCTASSVGDLPELLPVCSQTLKKLDIDLAYSPYSSKYMLKTGEVDNDSLPKLFSVPPNLQQLTIRAPVDVENDYRDNTPITSTSYFLAAATIMNFIVSPLQHLILNIDIYLRGIPSNLNKVDFSPLAVLGSASLSIARIDLYIHTGVLPDTVTLAQLLSSLEDYEDTMRSIKEGILVIHSEKIPPGCETAYWHPQFF